MAGREISNSYAPLAFSLRQPLELVPEDRYSVGRKERNKEPHELSGTSSRQIESGLNKGDASGHVQYLR